METLDLSQAIYSAGGNPLEYPSRIVSGAIYISGERLEALRPMNRFTKYITVDGVDVDNLLASNGAAPIAERVAQIAFGAHRNPENLAWKLADYNRRTGNEVSRDFLMMPAHVRNADVVACNMSSSGHMYSGLLTTKEGLGVRSYLLGAKCPVAIVLFDQAQMEAMHDLAGIPREPASRQGVRCDIATIPVHLDEDVACSAQTYSVAVPFLSLDGRPIAFSAVSTTGRSGYRSMSQEQMFHEINKLLAAERTIAGVTPIIDSVNRKRRELISEGLEPSRARQLEIFYSVKEELAKSYVLRDEDGKVRRGVEDIYPVWDEQDAWRFEPLFRAATIADGLSL